MIHTSPQQQRTGASAHSAARSDASHGAKPSPKSDPTVIKREAPGTMVLQAVREAGRIVDFRWESANVPAARLMRCEPDELCGKRMIEVIAGPLGHPALIDLYRRVVEFGNAQSFAQVHRVDGWHDVVVHRVVRSGDGVTVSLTNLSANRRAQAMRLGIESPSRRSSQ